MTKIEAFEILEDAEWPGTDAEREKVREAIDTLENEWADEWCHDCKEYDQEKCCCHRWTRVIRDTVEEVRETNRGKWIPVSEEMPPAYTEVLLQFDYNMAVGLWDNEDWFTNTGDRLYTPLPENGGKPIAWRWLPEGYVEGERCE